jgi:hypothetical protein
MSTPSRLLNSKLPSAALRHHRGKGASNGDGARRRALRGDRCSPDAAEVCVRVPGVNNGEGIPTRACGAASGGAGSAWMPGTAGCWLTAHADASDPSDDPSPREPVRRLEQREDHAALLEGAMLKIDGFASSRTARAAPARALTATATRARVSPTKAGARLAAKWHRRPRSA